MGRQRIAALNWWSGRKVVSLVAGCPGETVGIFPDGEVRAGIDMSFFEKDLLRDGVEQLLEGVHWEIP